MKKKEVLFISVIALGGVLLYVWGSGIIGSEFLRRDKIEYYIKAENTSKEGQLIPSFSILLPDSITNVNVDESPPGRSIVLFYFGPHCPFCQAEIDEITKNMDRLKDCQFYIFTTAAFDEMRSFNEQFRLHQYPNIKVGVDKQFFFAQYFQADRIPYVAIYGKDRRLNGAFVGTIRAGQIVEVAGR